MRVVRIHLLCLRDYGHFVRVRPILMLHNDLTIILKLHGLIPVDMNDRRAAFHFLNREKDPATERPVLYNATNSHYSYHSIERET